MMVKCLVQAKPNPIFQVQFLFSTLGTVEVVNLLVGVFFHPSEFREKLDHFPKVQGEKKQIWNHHLLLMEEILHHLGWLKPYK